MARLWKSANTAGEFKFMRKSGNSIQGDGHVPRAVGVSRKLSGSSRHNETVTLDVDA